MPASRPGEGLREFRQARTQRARGSQRTRRVVRLNRRRAEHAQRAVTLELVHPTALGRDRDRDRVEERVQRLQDLFRRENFRERGRADEVDEHDRDLPPFTRQAAPLAQRALRDLCADVAPEQVGQAVPLLQSCDHLVHARLQQPDLATVVDGHGDVEIASRHASDRALQRLERIGDRTSRDDGRRETDDESDE
jgi:hypothetical protein